MSVSNIFIIAGLISFAINLLWIPMVIWGKRMRKQITPRYHRLCQNSVRDGNLH